MTRDLNPVFSARPQSIFPTMSRLAREHGAINLGQGFPDEDGPAEILEIAARAILEGPNQYAPVEGVPELREAVARDNKRFYGLDIDPDTETLVFSGATEGLAAALLGYLNPGDEAIVLAPFYECYAPQIEAAGARVVPVNLAPPGWRLDAGALDRAVTDRTRLIVINTPHNPLGKVMTRAELEIIAAAARAHDLIVVCDEVYEHLAYTSPAPLQKAVAAGLAMGDDYYARFTAAMQEKRDFLSAGLARAGLEALPCEGTYFITVDIASAGREDDAAFCREITREAKVAAVPVSAFYHPRQEDVSRRYARFCFCKKREVLEEASTRLARYLRGRA